MAVLDRGLKGLPKEKLTSSTGLVGQKMMCKVIAKELSDGYPFAQYDEAVPIEVIGEYPNFLVCTVLPHKANTTQRFGISSPYQICIQKFALTKGEIKLTPMP